MGRQYNTLFAFLLSLSLAIVGIFGSFGILGPCEILGPYGIRGGYLFAENLKIPSPKTDSETLQFPAERIESYLDKNGDAFIADQVLPLAIYSFSEKCPLHLVDYPTELDYFAFEVNCLSENHRSEFLIPIKKSYFNRRNLPRKNSTYTADLKLQTGVNVGSFPAWAWTVIQFQNSNPIREVLPILDGNKYLLSGLAALKSKGYNKYPNPAWKELVGETFVTDERCPVSVISVGEKEFGDPRRLVQVRIHCLNENVSVRILADESPKIEKPLQAELKFGGYTHRNSQFTLLWDTIIIPAP